MSQVKHAFAITATRGAVLACVVSLSGCSMFGDSPRTDDKVDYRTSARKVAPLDVPPDLTALARDGRYVPQAGRISASELNQGPRTASVSANTATTVALNQAGDLKIERAGQQRWLVSGRTPEQLWPQVRAFWEDAGFKLVREDAAVGLIETDWAENRAKLPDDLVTATVGRIFSNLVSTGQRDRYRTRLERTAAGTEIYVSQQGIEEVFVGKDRDYGTTWSPRPHDPELEAEMLSRMLLALSGGAKTGTSAANSAVPSPAAVANGATTSLPAKARVLSGEPAATLQLDDAQERAWRRVGLALDRSGFTVEERDRASGSYAVRYVDAKEAAKDAPNFIMKWFGAKDPTANALGRYRIAVKAESANVSRISVQTPGGQPDNSPNAQRIVSTLVEELKY